MPQTDRAGPSSRVTPVLGAAAPAPWLTLLEVRALAEFGLMPASFTLLRRLPQGDGHPVLVLPGFTADDRSTRPLRRMLRSLGYRTHGWRLGRNLGPTPQTVEGLVTRLAVVHDEHAEPVSLVGWSLGGIYARELARAAPGSVRQVITLGSPFRLMPDDRTAASRRYERLNLPRVERPDAGVPEADRPPLSVPATAIYTRTDGIVRWWHCIESEAPTRESIAVRGSHSGLGFNPAVAYAVADRLAQPAGQWRPFRPPAWARPWYPPSETWRESPAGRAQST